MKREAKILERAPPVTTTSSSYASSSTLTLPSSSSALPSNGSTNTNTTFDANAAAAESSFIVSEVPPNNSTGGAGNFSLPALCENLSNATALVDGTTTYPGNASYNAADGMVYISLYDTSSSVQLIGSADGNLYLTAYNPNSAPVPGSSFGSYQSVVITDAQNHLILFYPSQIAAYNVSRFRLANDTFHIPRTSRMLSLTPVSVYNQGIYVGVDTLGNFYNLVWCNMASGKAKVFVTAGDTNAAIALLQSNSLDWTVA